MPDSAALPDAARARLQERVRAHWPELGVRLADKLAAFVDLAIANAGAHGLVQKASVARFLNLCCAFGPHFERRPENEWALAILADDRLGEWVKLHQLVVRGATELKRRGAEGNAADGRSASDQLLRSDRALLAAIDAEARADNSDAAPLAQLACDLEAVDIRLLEVDWRREYLIHDGAWQRVAITDPALSIRIGPGGPAPSLVCVLTRTPAAGVAARLQVRLLTHAVCNQDRHPQVVFAGEDGLSSWTGHNARAVSWHVYCHAAQPCINGLDVVLVEETVPRTSLLQATACGLRDEGVPVGPMQTFVWAYPADQWLFVWEREAAVQQHWPQPANVAPARPAAPTRCRIERDGVAVPSTRWARAFHDTLDPQLVEGFEALFAAWQEVTTDASMTVTAGLLTGHAALSWGWREGTQGLSGGPLMRVLTDVDLVNSIELLLAGEIAIGVTRTRIRLIVQGSAPMKQQLARERAVPTLLESLLPVVGRWRFAYRVEFDPVAVEQGALWSEAGPCVGALVGEAGLRPRTTGGSGWQWYARLDSEALAIPVCLHDPVLGQTRSTLALLPAVRLLDWSLG